MRIRDVSVGQRVAVSRGLAGKHLNVAGDRGEPGDIEAICRRWQSADHTPGLPLEIRMRIVVQGYVETVASQLNAAISKPFHHGVVLEVGVWWGGRRAGCAVEIDVPQRDDRGRWTKAWAWELLEGADSVTIVVPSSMLTDYDEAAIAGARLALQSEREGALFRDRLAEVRKRAEDQLRTRRTS